MDKRGRLGDILRKAREIDGIAELYWCLVDEDLMMDNFNIQAASRIGWVLC